MCFLRVGWCHYEDFIALKFTGLVSYTNLPSQPPPSLICGDDGVVVDIRPLYFIVVKAWGGTRVAGLIAI